MKSKNCNLCVVLSPAWPSNDSGYGIAIKSSLKIYEKLYDQILLVVISDKDKNELLFEYKNCISKHIFVKRKSKWIRFFKSILSTIPASAIYYSNKSIQKELYKYLSDFYSKESELTIIFEDIPIAQYISKLSKRFINSKIIIRSHNVFSEIFEGFDKIGSPIMKILWKIENYKCYRMESHALEQSDLTFSITNRDGVEYRKRYNYTVNGTLGIYLDTDNYKDILIGDISNIIYLGTADFRKSHGINNFIKNVWNFLFPTDMRLRLIMAGRGTENFNSPSQNIEGMGYIENEKSLLDLGIIFINPQERGSGLKIKSLVAMLSGKVVVSMKKGLEGIDALNGYHYYCVDNYDEFKEIIQQLQNDYNKALEIGSSAKKWVATNYNLTHFLNDTLKLFE